jgi:predicted RNA binding protein YcfA (HicA-like mRNA interferase family)
MPLKPLSSREIKRRLEAAGFEVAGQKGRVDTIGSILRQARLCIDEFDNL